MNAKAYRLCGRYIASQLASDNPAAIWLPDEWHIGQDSGPHELALRPRYAGLQTHR